MSFLLSGGQQSCRLIKSKSALARGRATLRKVDVGSVVERDAVLMGFCRWIFKGKSCLIEVRLELNECKHQAASAQSMIR